MSKYGFPYRGSKARHADEILSVIPAAKNFYDLFAGGCAITHAALVSDKWKNIHANDLQNTPQLFLDAVAGKYRNERRWISREEFLAKKATDPYIRWVWSFGNNGEDYLFGRAIEPVKKAAHEYLFSHGYDGTRGKRKELIAQFKAEKEIKRRFDLEQLERPGRLEQLERLQQPERLERFSVSALDYRKIRVKKDSVVYCDPPYPHKPGYKEKYYGLDFDADAFYSWARSAAFPVYFSSSVAPRDFRVVWEKETDGRMNNKNSAGKKSIVERLFWNGVK